MASVAVVPAVVSRPSAHALAYAGLAVATVGWTAGFIAGKLALAEMTPLPVLTALASAVLLGERLAVTQAFGGAAVLAGVYCTTRGGGGTG